MLRRSMTFLSHLRWIAGRALFAVAALILSLGCSVDAVAGAAKASVEAGHGGVIVKAIAAFDVIDDALDHLPGKAGGEPQQQLVLPLPPAPDIAMAPPQGYRTCGWSLGAGLPPGLCAPEGLERPPRP